MEYDPNAVTQVKAALTGTSGKDYLSCLNGDGHASLVYTAADDPLPGTGSIVLQCRTDSSCPAESLSLNIRITDAADASANVLLSEAETYAVEIPFSPLPSSDCSLLSLTPPAGTLIPDFDPHTFEYTLEVPFTYTTLTFDAIPSDGAIMRVNRKNLGAGGTTVDFNFTVTAADGDTQTVYTVSVTRLKKESPASSASPSPESSGKEETSDESTEKSQVSEADSNTETAESAESPETSNAPNIYIYQASEPNSVTDRLITAAIVLLSVIVGTGIAFLLQICFSKGGRHSGPK